MLNTLDWEEYDEEIFVIINGAAISLEACVNSGSGELAQVSVASRGTDVESGTSSQSQMPQLKRLMKQS